MAEPTKEQLQAEREQLVKELKSNLDSMTRAEKVAGIERVRRLDLAITQAAAAEAEAAEQRALQERPLSITGEPPPSREPPKTAQELAQRMPASGSPEADQLKRISAAGGIARLFEGGKQLAQILRIKAKDMIGSPTIEDRIELNRMRIEFAKQHEHFRTALTTDAKALGIEPWTIRASEEIGGILPEAMLTGGATSLMRTSLKRVAAEGGFAALGGAIQPARTDEEFVTNVLSAGTVGTGAATLVWGANLLPNLQRRTLESGRTGVLDFIKRNDPSFPDIGMSSPQARDAQRLAAAFDPRLAEGEAGLTPAMLTRNPTLAQVERGVASGPGSPKDAKLKAIEDVVFERFSTVADSLNPEQLSFPTIVTTARTSMMKNLDTLKEARKRAWDSSMDKAVMLSGGKVLREGSNVRRVGGAPIIEADTFVKTLNSLLSEIPERGLPPEAEQAVYKFAKRWGARLHDNSRFTAADTQQLLIELTDEMGGAGVAFKGLGGKAGDRWAGTLKDAVMVDLDNTIANGDELRKLLREFPDKPAGQARERAAAGEIAKFLKEARETYAVNSAKIDSFKAQALWKVLGKLDTNDSTWLDRVMGLPPEEVSQFLKYADEAQPGLANAVRGRVLMDTFEKNRLPQVEGAAQRFDLGAVFSDLTGGGRNFGMSRFEAMFPANGQFSNEEIKLAQKGLKVLQMIATPNLAAESVSQQSRIREAMINVIAQDPGFTSRWIVGEYTPMQLEKMIYSKEGVQSLMQLGKFHGQDRLVLKTAGQGFAPQTATQAMANFVAHVNGMLAEEERMKQAELERERLKQVVAQGDPRAMARGQ